ncbi:MAG: glyoxalase [Nocardioidaceae bacterium]|jgi:catechol 2,3-dioxygenase-like lactoylglutathione lyase family enzyme|nr:glyoxalase [Nocardioidaceae bacterium]
MTVKRVVPDLATPTMEASQRFYADVLELVPVMDQGWIVTLAGSAGVGQVSLMTHDATAPVVPAMSIEVDDVDAAYAAAVATGAEIVHPLTDEPWGVRRFFVRDPAGHVVNVLAHD